MIVSDDLNEELRRLSRKLETANDQFRSDGHEWARAEDAYKGAKATKRLASKADNPKATIPELDALVDIGCARERTQAYIARANREASHELVRSLRSQLSALQSIAASVRSEIEMAAQPQPRWTS
jgi:hypothetical protein